MKKLIQKILFGEPEKDCEPIGKARLRTVSCTASNLYEVQEYQNPLNNQSETNSDFSS